MRTKQFDLSAQATIHVAGQTIQKPTFFNAICDLEGTDLGAPAVVDVCGRCFTTREIENIRDSPDFRKHRQSLKTRGKDRD